MFQSRTLLSFIEDKTGDIFFERSLETSVCRMCLLGNALSPILICSILVKFPQYWVLGNDAFECDVIRTKIQIFG